MAIDIHLTNDEVWEGTKQVGYLEGTTFYDMNREEVGWYDNDTDSIWRADGGAGIKAGYLENGDVHYANADIYDSAAYVHREVADGAYSELCAAAAALLFGDS